MSRYTLFLLSAALLTAASPLPALAISAPACHCFTDRSYDPAHPTVADPYFLASAQNSFFASYFGVEKRDIVVMKQGGTSGDDLWIAWWIASRSGRSGAELLDNKGHSWADTVATQNIQPRQLGEKVAAALKAKALDYRVAEAVVDELFIGRKLMQEKEVQSLRKAGATNQELILSALLAARTGQTASLIYKQAKTAGKSWGELLKDARLEPSAFQQESARLLKK